jgi:hypothetical protein
MYPRDYTFFQNLTILKRLVIFSLIKYVIYTYHEIIHVYAEFYIYEICKTHLYLNKPRNLAGTFLLGICMKNLMFRT